MASIILLSNPHSDDAALSGGGWEPELPLANMQNGSLRRVSRSSGLSAVETQFRISLASDQSFKSIVFGPTNMTTAGRFKISKYADAAFSQLVITSDWISNVVRVPFGTLQFGMPYWWSGQRSTWPDSERGAWMVHTFDAPTAGQYWKIEIDDSDNPDGYIDVGRLFMADHWSPSINYSPDGNGLGFVNNTLTQRTLSGGKRHKRRMNPRVFQWQLPFLSQSEGYGEAYSFAQQAGFDGEVFVIPDPDDVEYIQQRCFLGNLTEIDALSQSNFNHIGTGFQIEEIL